MKQKLIYCFMLICSLSILASCKDDDNDKIDLGTAIAGTYKGDLTVSLGSENQAGDPIKQKIKIIKIDEEHVQLEINNFNFGIPIGNIVVKDIPVSKKGDIYEFTATKTTLELIAPIGTVDVNITSGAIKGEELTLKIEVIQLSIPLNIYVNFIGNKMSDNGSNEANILKFSIANKFIVGDPSIEKNTITIYVADSTKTEDLKFTPTIETSPFSTVAPASGIQQDFSSPVIYTVTAEDGTTKTYTVSYLKTGKYDFEAWTLKNEQDNAASKYMEYYEPAGQWSTSNAGVSLIKLISYYDKELPYAVESTQVSHSGKYAAELMTLDTKGAGDGSYIPKITSGSLFLGVFDMDKMSDDEGNINRLNCTLFGIPYASHPLSLKGYYKYTPGSKFYNNMEEDNTGKKDQCAISGVLYEINDENETLDGNNIYTSDKIVMTAIFSDGSIQTEWTAFNIPFTLVQGKTYDPNKKYKLAVIFSSSKDGDRFQGAPGSTLCIDDVEVISE